MYKIGPEKLEALLPDLDAKQFSAEAFLKAGVFVIRQAITQEHLSSWIEAWEFF